MAESLDSMSDRPVEKDPGGSGGTSSEGADVLAEVLDRLGLESRLFCRSELRAPWAMGLPSGDFAHFHAIERGGAWLSVPGGTPLALTAGDLVVLPHGGGHQLADAPGRGAVALESLLQPRPGGACSIIRHGGDGPETWMICGSFRFRRRRGHPLLSLLPPVLQLRSSGGRAPEWLEATLRQIAAESRDPRPGSRAVISRLTDVLFIQVVRAWIDARPEGKGSWLDGLRDARIAAALGLIHQQPERAWTVAALAAQVGMSRSPFAARFSRLVGEPPLGYLSAWRVQVAADLLRSERMSLAEVAMRVGYESEAAFGKAFKRRLGISPGAWRRQAA